MTMSKASWRLADDHYAIGEVLQELKAALERGDVETSRARLDLFWARLAVHIRAEHLHLFPTVMAGVREKTPDDSSELVPMAAEAAIDQLRDDHNFFMHALADAIQRIRTLRKSSNEQIDPGGLKEIQTAVLEIEKRLVSHNQLEEERVYRWAGDVLSEQRQAELATQIERELANRPPRFSPETWQHS